MDAAVVETRTEFSRHVTESWEEARAITNLLPSMHPWGEVMRSKWNEEERYSKEKQKDPGETSRQARESGTAHPERSLVNPFPAPHTRCFRLPSSR